MRPIILLTLVALGWSPLARSSQVWIRDLSLLEALAQADCVVRGTVAPPAAEQQWVALPVRVKDADQVRNFLLETVQVRVDEVLGGDCGAVGGMVIRVANADPGLRLRWWLIREVTGLGVSPIADGLEGGTHLSEVNHGGWTGIFLLQRPRVEPPADQGDQAAAYLALSGALSGCLPLALFNSVVRLDRLDEVKAAIASPSPLLGFWGSVPSGRLEDIFEATPPAPASP